MAGLVQRTKALPGTAVLYTALVLLPVAILANSFSLFAISTSLLYFYILLRR